MFNKPINYNSNIMVVEALYFKSIVKSMKMNGPLLYINMWINSTNNVKWKKADTPTEVHNLLFYSLYK